MTKTLRIFALLAILASFTWLHRPIVQASSFEKSSSGMGENPTDNGAKRDERTLVLCYWQPASTANPYISGGTTNRDAAALVLEPLASYDDTGQLVPRLAVEIPTLRTGGVSADGKTITWVLRSDLLWSDQTPVTADDVVFTWQYCADPDTGCVAAANLDAVQLVEAMNDKVVLITFKTAQFDVYGPFVGANMPILQKTQFSQCIGSPAQNCTEENLAPIGTGPYQITDFKVNDRVTYIPNPHYRDAIPYFDEVFFLGGGSQLGTATAVLQTGTADYGWNLQIEPLVLSDLESNGVGKIVNAYGGTVERILVNQTNPDPALGGDRSVYKPDGSNAHPILTDARIVRALSLAIDRTVIAQSLYGAVGRPTCNLITMQIYASPNNNECLTQDFVQARTLLDEAGLVDMDGDGWRDRVDGASVILTLQTSTNSIRQGTQTLLKDWWAQIGVNSQMIHHSASDFFGGDPNNPNTYQKFYADLEMYSNGPVRLDLASYLADWTCGEIPLPENNFLKSNIPRWCNEDYEDKLQELIAETDPDARADLVILLNDLLVQEGVEIPLVNRAGVSAHKKDLLGVRMNAWDSELWNIAEWRRDTPVMQDVFLPFLSR